MILSELTPEKIADMKRGYEELRLCCRVCEVDNKTTALKAAAIRCRC